jgi:hypothetical protein
MYGDGEFLRGQPGYQDVTVAGITVKKQEICLVETAYWVRLLPVWPAESC